MVAFLVTIKFNAGSETGSDRLAGNDYGLQKAAQKRPSDYETILPTIGADGMDFGEFAKTITLSAIVVNLLAWAISKILEATAPEGVWELLTRVTRIVVTTASIAVGLMIASWFAWFSWTTYRSRSQEGPSSPQVQAFEATPQSIASGSITRLRWAVVSATEIVIDHGIGRVTAAASVDVKPAETTIYSLTATGPGGQVQSHVKVEVAAPQPPQITLFTAVPPLIEPGGSTKLKWEVSGATSVVLDQGIGRVSATSTLDLKPSVSTTYTLVATGPGGTLSAHATVSVSTIAYAQPGNSVSDRTNPTATTDSLSSLPNADVELAIPTQTKVDIRLQHRHFGGTVSGTFSISSRGLTWNQDDGRNSFNNKPCNAIISTNRYNDGFDPTKLRLDLKVEGQPYDFDAQSSDYFEAAKLAYDSLCYPSAFVLRYSSPGLYIHFYSQDKGDSIRLTLTTSEPCGATMLIDVNQNGLQDDPDIEYYNEGQKDVACRVVNQKRDCKYTGKILEIRQEGAETQVTRVISKRELTSTKRPMAFIYLWMSRSDIKYDQWSPAIIIPFEIQFAK